MIGPSTPSTAVLESSSVSGHKCPRHKPSSPAPHRSSLDLPPRGCLDRYRRRGVMPHVVIPAHHPPHRQPHQYPSNEPPERPHHDDPPDTHHSGRGLGTVKKTAPRSRPQALQSHPL